MTFSDAHGPWTHDNQTVNYLDSDGSPATSTRTALYLGGNPHPQYFAGPGPFPAAGSWEGGFFILFGCYTAVHPCIGLRTIEIDLGQEVLGFGGLLDYYKGYMDFSPGPGLVPIPLLADAYAASGGVSPSGAPSDRFFNDFFGVIFDQPTSVIRLAWWEDQHMDDTSSVRFTSTFLVTAMPVPEPGAVGLLAAALLGLITIRRAPLPATARRRGG
ncbi:PEP-CTERM sorting domain-containing protein [Elioraea sp.]|uniref:PEP-CTERM sorting domain-containing protein n=1 Tax=Elioraea sp. TaxID=2185103 RepID=UPI003F706204